jgi:hypothetical protein
LRPAFKSDSIKNVEQIITFPEWFHGLNIDRPRPPEQRSNLDARANPKFLNQLLVMDMVLTKSEDWAYEEEFRAIGSPDYQDGHVDADRCLFEVQRGTQDKLTTKYARLSPGKGLIGEWQLIYMERQFTSGTRDFSIEQFGQNGREIASAWDQNHLKMNFDGKSYITTGPSVQKGSSTSGKRVSPHILQLED